MKKIHLSGILFLFLCANIFAVDIAPDFQKYMAQRKELDNALSLYRNSKYTEALPILKRLTADSNPVAEYLYATCLASGSGLPQNSAQAVEIYKKLVPHIDTFAQKGDALSQHILGGMYFRGEGVMQDNTEAVKWYRKAADQGYAASQNNLGGMYLNGEGVGKDEVEARKWLQKAADQGNPVAQYRLGVIYSGGSGVEKDDAEAAKWFRKSADQGFSAAQFALGVYLEGEGAYAEAINWLKKSAEQGIVDAQFNLGAIYSKGEIVEQDLAESFRWYRKAADQDDAAAQYNMGVSYANGRGVAMDDAEAFKWFRKSAERGNANAQNNLGVRYHNGEGVKKDDAEAIKWFRKSAAQGNTNAQRSLKELDNGEISEQDIAEAKRIQADVMQEQRKLIKKYGEVATKTATMNLSDKVGNSTMVLNLKIKIILSTLDITGEMSLENMQKNLPDSIMRYNPIIENRKDGVISLAFYEDPSATNVENIIIADFGHAEGCLGLKARGSSVHAEAPIGAKRR